MSSFAMSSTAQHCLQVELFHLLNTVKESFHVKVIRSPWALAQTTCSDIFFSKNLKQ